MDNNFNTSDNKEKKRGKMPGWLKVISALLLVAVGVAAGLQIKLSRNTDTVQNKVLAAAKTVSSPFVSLPTATAPEYIGTVGAKEAALKHAKISEDEAQFYTISLEKENGIMVYELEFVAGGTEYDYDVNAMTGTIESYKSEQQSASTAKNKSQDAGVDAVTSATQKTQGADNTDAVSAATEKLDSSSGNLPDLIGESAAKEKALNHAGIKEADISRYSCELELKRMNLVYDIEFKNSGYEYEYIVDATTGDIISYDRDKDTN